MTDTTAATPPAPGEPRATRAQRHTARRAVRRAERTRRRAAIDARARLLADRQIADTGAAHCSLEGLCVLPTPPS